MKILSRNLIGRLIFDFVLKFQMWELIRKLNRKEGFYKSVIYNAT
ncbi:hypothetical protein LEP1GSC172_2186 [Leptospira noguchii]|uniref:Uncharacterized protein n=1 Tax=Leptospira noguchii TaxID=28182 RepID=M6VDR1_9LEPT|nr:hypothetical protein LEP1GSC172_2186 [Leptospira noguchii]